MRPPSVGRFVPPGSSFLLLPAAAVAVHQLRYWLAYGSRANAELAAQGHSYLQSLVPWTIFAAAVAGGLFLRRAAAALRVGGPGTRRRLPVAALWLATSLTLLAVYASQELLESLLATGHPSGMAGVVGHGGWWAVPAAAAVALVVVALLLVGRALLRVAAEARRERRRPSATVVMPTGVVPAVVTPLARAAAGRAPPLRLPSR